MKPKNYRRPKAHKNVKVMWLSAKYRLEYKRNRQAFLADHPEVLQMPSFDQQYILT
jgi:hypothetical protein